MRRIFVLLTALVVTAFCLFSCAADTVSDPFTVFYGDINAVCRVDVQGAKSEILFSRRGGAIKAEFTAPQKLAGFVLSQEGEVTYLSHGDLAVPIQESAALILNLCKDAFSPHYASITDIQSEKSGGETLTVITARGFIYAFSANGTPKSISGTHSGKQFTLQIGSISLAQSVTESGKG